MKLIFENWRRFIKEETAAFHGWDMSPTEMRVGPCNVDPYELNDEGERKEDDEKKPIRNKDHGYYDSQWEAGEAGCPQFSNLSGIGLDHPDIQQAVEFLNNVQPSDLIAYSRGGAVALGAFGAGAYQPYVIFVAPAWKRGWVNGIESPTFSNGVIVHGTKDDKVPLSHSVELSDLTGMELYVFDGLGHVNILKHKLDWESGKLWQKLSQEEKDELIRQSMALAKDKKED